jgi:GSH-dependent disulfide-bond oxidoreductase
MLTVYAFASPNAVKVPIGLEELGLDYKLKPVNIRQGEQKLPDFVALNRNGKIPVLVDDNAEGGPLVLTESAAILIYLAEKSGKLLPASGVARARVFEQLFFHASGVGPAFGNAGYFRKLAPEPVPAAIDRFGAEADRVIGVLDAVLGERRYVAGDELSIADILHWGWMWRREFVGASLDAAPNVARWFDELANRPAFQRAVDRVNALVPA